MQGSAVDRHVGQRMRARREACGISAATFSQALGITEATLMAWETGEQRPENLLFLEAAHLLACPAADFFEGLPDRKPPAGYWIFGDKGFTSGWASPEDED